MITANPRRKHDYRARNRAGWTLHTAPVLLLLLALLLTACGESIPSPTLPPDTRPTETPLPPAPAWRQPSAPISLDNIPQLALLGRLEAPGSPSTIFATALSPDNTRLAAINNTLTLAWDLVTGELVFSTSNRGATRIFYSPDKDEVYTLVPEGGLYILNSDDGSYEAELAGIEQHNGVLDYVPDAGLLALASSDGSVKVWDLFERQALVTLTEAGLGQPLALSFSPDTNWLAVSYDIGTIYLWDWRNRQPLTVFAPLPGSSTGGIPDQLRFSGDGRYLVGIAYDALGVWDVPLALSSGIPDLQAAITIEPGSSINVFKFLPPDAAPARQTTFLTIGLPASGSLIDAATTQAVAALPGVGGDTADAAFAPDGRLLVTVHPGSPVTLWNLVNLEAGSIARSLHPTSNDQIINTLWTGDSFLMLLLDLRGPVEVWGIP